MSSALELRAPFLDEGVMEFAKALRVKDRVRGFKTKVFLKRYARRYLPNNIVNRRKRGLSVPIGSWLRGPLKEWATATLENGRLEQARDSHVCRYGTASPNIASAKPTMPAPFGPCSSWGNGWIGWRRTPTAVKQVKAKPAFFADPPSKFSEKGFFAPACSSSRAASADQLFQRK